MLLCMANHSTPAMQHAGYLSYNDNGKDKKNPAFLAESGIQNTKPIKVYRCTISPLRDSKKPPKAATIGSSEGTLF